MITERYRQDYDGEFIIRETRITNNASLQEREWLPNPVINQHISSRAAVVGSDTDSKYFNWRLLKRHKGGLLAKKKLQTYGSGQLFRDMKFDFMVIKDDESAEQILESDYQINSVVYATPRICLDHPGSFYVVPHLPSIDILAQAVYLAAFDAHKEIFLIGYSKDTPSGNKKWAADVKEVFDAYPTTQFFVVTHRSIDDSWCQCPNVQQMPYRKFVFYCDV